MGGWVHSAGVFGSTDWTCTGVNFNAGSDTRVTVAARLGYYAARLITGKTTRAKITCTLGEADSLYARPTSSGTMWCDDLTWTKGLRVDLPSGTGSNWCSLDYAAGAERATLYVTYSAP